jgi:class 3 adenylate cyclase
LTAALVVVGLLLQFVFRGELSLNWTATYLPLIVGAAFAVSFVVGVATEVVRLISAPLLLSALLGTYQRRRLIVMFLDLANSTHLAEEMGELKVHDLITRFSFDIDGPIADFGGAVHNYVGDEVIVSWPVSSDPTRNAHCIACFFAIESKIARLAPDYATEFNVIPEFRAGIHAGPVVVSECGDTKRQLAFFGDTMNVAARLCELCKAKKRICRSAAKFSTLFKSPAATRARKRNSSRFAADKSASRCASSLARPLKVS